MAGRTRAGYIVAGGFCGEERGSKEGLRRLSSGDGDVILNPRTSVGRRGSCSGGGGQGRQEFGGGAVMIGWRLLQARVFRGHSRLRLGVRASPLAGLQRPVVPFHSRIRRFSQQGAKLAVARGASAAPMLVIHRRGREHVSAPVARFAHAALLQRAGMEYAGLCLLLWVSGTLCGPSLRRREGSWWGRDLDVQESFQPSHECQAFVDARSQELYASSTAPGQSAHDMCSPCCSREILCQSLALQHQPRISAAR
ncbi:hypothetical protein FH972_021131 [Carpinus fangiana]|uniref:Uncharacterized protein n=1 Tax=Carpinus fangiana TaxID=176857 RepID=A0A5N6KNF6_9ROSI|nr:hypothetical protein FH972_021131 [Carpinus fangiana]